MNTIQRRRHDSALMGLQWISYLGAKLVSFQGWKVWLKPVQTFIEAITSRSHSALNEPVLVTQLVQIEALRHLPCRIRRLQSIQILNAHRWKSSSYLIDHRIPMYIHFMNTTLNMILSYHNKIIITNTYHSYSRSHWQISSSVVPVASDENKHTHCHCVW